MAIRQSASAGGDALAIGSPRRRRPPRQQGPPTMSGRRWHAPSASPTPWDGTCDADLTPSQVAVRDSHGGACELRHRTPSETGDASFPDRHVRERCPRCGDERVCRWGREADGARRHGRGACGRTFTSSTGTIFEDHKLPVADRAESVGQALGFESLEAMTREGGRGGATTAWRVARPLAVPRGTRDGVMPSGEARIDERTRPLAAKDRVGGAAGMGAYPGDRICIAVGCDDAGRSLVARAGLGRPGKSRCWDAYGGHIERGPGPARDMGSAHSILVDRPGPGGVACRSAGPGGLDDAHDPLRRANHTHFPLRESARRHSGLGRDRIDDWPDLLSVIVNPPPDRLERVAMAPGRAMPLPISLPYRGHHERDGSSG